MRGIGKALRKRMVGAADSFPFPGVRNTPLQHIVKLHEHVAGGQIAGKSQ
jgi:hypothetical protein